MDERHDDTEEILKAIHAGTLDCLTQFAKVTASFFEHPKIAEALSNRHGLLTSAEPIQFSPPGLSTASSVRQVGIRSADMQDPVSAFCIYCEEIQDEYDRLKLWARNLGAFNEENKRDLKVSSTRSPRTYGLVHSILRNLFDVYKNVRLTIDSDSFWLSNLAFRSRNKGDLRKNRLFKLVLNFSFLVAVLRFFL